MKKVHFNFMIDYGCYDCESGQNSLLCKGCFEAGNHLGHRFEKRYSPGDGGICDCGNEMMIKKSGFCDNHSGQP